MVARASCDLPAVFVMQTTVMAEEHTRSGISRNAATASKTGLTFSLD
jgi:hypothetical protein